MSSIKQIGDGREAPPVVGKVGPAVNLRKNRMLLNGLFYVRRAGTKNGTVLRSGDNRGKNRKVLEGSLSEHNNEHLERKQQRLINRGTGAKRDGRNGFRERKSISGAGIHFDKVVLCGEI